jgi:hypothetical protein
MAAVLSGGCQCGAVRYALAAMPQAASLCHCRMCQKASGGPFGAFATVPQTAFAWTRGDPPAWRSSSAAERHFCPACGTPLTFRYVDKPTISVTIGSLDHPERVPPTRSLGLEARLPWMTGAVLDALPGSQTTVPTAGPQGAALTSFQHPDHDTPDGWTAPM